VPGGTFYVVATPLGHLGDLSARVTQVLHSVPLVAAEDTRRTRALLSHLDAHPRILAYHAHDKHAGGAILNALREGKDVALVTDAGTPGVSDPGVELVERVRSAGFLVVPLPGPSAVAAALSAAGLPADRYVFYGFLPRKGSERARLLARAGEEEWTMVFFESPERIGALLVDLARGLGPDRPAVVAREMTKVHEEFRVGTLGELATTLGPGESVKGEVTLVVAGRGEVREAADATEIEQAAAKLLGAGLARREVSRLLMELFGASRNQAYRAVNSEP
jgi:16S rRNA (cytidine1402-2'-O)-methyltransferase